MLAHGARRASEFAVRTAVGGGRGRLLRQLLTESAVVAALGGLGGLLLAGLALDVIVGLMPADVPRVPQIAVNGRLLAFAGGLVVVTALAFGSAPAVHVLRQSAHGLLRGQRTGAAGARLRRALVAAEVALALVLLIGAGLLVQSFARLVRVDLGFAPANTVALQVFQYPDGRSWVPVTGRPGTASFFRETLRDIRALPGVAGAGAVSSLPLALADVTREPVDVARSTATPTRRGGGGCRFSCDPGYFETMRIPLQVGRWFDDRDDGEGRAGAVINETLARQHWPESDPIDQRVTVQLSGQAHTADVVGVVGTVRPRGFESRPRSTASRRSISFSRARSRYGASPRPSSRCSAPSPWFSPRSASTA